MINQIKYIITTETNPYKNLALEEYLLKHVKDNECILYLWQNERTVVIGRNQNPWKECKIGELEADDGKLVRRLSGGGAVFHDLGNLNFTFFAANENYNVEKQLEVILKAVNRLGIAAVKTGRNDIAVEDRKFSGNAFYTEGNHSYHHGTILVNVDMTKLSHYLNVSREKLVSKGVESVRSRVTNLIEYRPDLNVDRMKEELIQAFGEVYELTPTQIELERIDTDELKLMEGRFSSWDWIYGKKMEFNFSLEQRFAWGDIDIRMNIASGIIVQCAMFSDALETTLFERLGDELIGCSFITDTIIKRLEAITVQQQSITLQQGITVQYSAEQIIKDIIRLFQENAI